MIEWFRNLLSDLIHSFVAGFLSGFFANYIVGLYFHIKGIKKRGLTYKVNEVRTQIVKGGEASKLTVLYKDAEMAGDIMAAHIAIWNQGRESIRQTDILRPLVIETENHTPILESNVRKTTRDVIGLRIGESKCDQGQLSVSWDILETNDGGIIQIIYAGSPDIGITARAIVEGQQKIIDHSQFIPPKPGAERSLYFAKYLMSFFIAYWLLELYLDIERFSSASDLSQILWWVSILNFVLWFTGFIGLVLIVFIFSSILRQQKPPFEF